MSYDIFFLRRDPGQSFTDALDELERGFEGGSLAELDAEDLEQWDELLGRAREVLGEVEVVETEDDTTRELVAPSSRVELTFVRGEIEIHVPQPGRDVDTVELMRTVYELARVVEDVTGLEGYDPQVGEPVSDLVTDRPAPRREPRGDGDGDDVAPARADAGGGAAPVGDPRPDMAPEPTARPRRWWEFWRS